MNRVLERKPFALAVLGLAAALVVFFLDWTGVLGPFQNKAYDGLFYLDARFLPPVPRPESPVVLVGIDDATFAHQTFHIPETLWHNYFGEVIQGIADGGAKAVGLDFLLPQALFDELVPNASRRWLMTFVYAKKKGSPVVSGLFQLAGRQIKPEARFLQILGREYVGLFNLTTDSDDFIRRQKLFFPAADGSGDGLYNVTFLLARRLKPDLQPPGEVIYIDYDPSDNPFPKYSFAEVYDRAVAKDLDYFKKRFEGRVVLIGETDSITQDRHATPLYPLARSGQRRTPGVEILVHTVRTLIGDRFFHDVPWPVRGLMYLGLALLSGLLTLYVSPKIPLWVTLPAAVLAWSAAGLGMYRLLWVMPVVGGLAALLIGEGSFFAFRHWVVDREKRVVKNAFSLYMSPEVVAQVIEKPELLSLGGSRRVMTVFFSDLAGFTNLSEKLAPEDLVHLLNRYLGLMTGAIMRSGGTVDKYEGDAIMAFWGAPLPREDHALRACLSALEQQEIMARFRAEVLAEGLPKLEVRMGINTGPMIVGNMGSEERFDYTVMGDAVNLASRLEGANKSFGTYIMISETTYAEVKELVEARELDLLRVKGRAEPIRVYELLARKGELDARTAEIRDLFTDGLEKYRNRDFSGALESFGRVLAIDPQDGPGGVYVERCQAFQIAPPPEDWDGVFTLTTK